jgi:hypothetical protein
MRAFSCAGKPLVICGFGLNAGEIEIPLNRSIHLYLKAGEVQRVFSRREPKTNCQLNEADTCRRYVEPRLRSAGWDDEPHSFTEQQSFTDGRIVVAGEKPRRKSSKRADYFLQARRPPPPPDGDCRRPGGAPAGGAGAGLPGRAVNCNQNQIIINPLESFY